MSSKFIFPALIAASTLFGQADPLTGKVWTFSIEATGGDPAAIVPTMRAPVPGRSTVTAFAISGQAVASNGSLDILATTIIDDGRGEIQIQPDSRAKEKVDAQTEQRAVTRLERDIGFYTINASGTGGTITMNLSSNPMQYDFWFYNNNRSIHLVSTVQGRPAIGSATWGPSGCPAGTTNSLSVLSGDYTFQTIGIARRPYPFGIIGVFTASGAPNPATPFLSNGLLSILATSNLTFGGSVTRLERDAGTYQVSPNCLYGTLTMNLSSRPVQYDFYFRDGFQSGVMISTSPGVNVFGEFNR